MPAIKAAFPVPFGSGGPPDYYYRLCRLIKAKYSDFQPEGMDDWEAEQSEEHIQLADTKLKEIVSGMRKYLFDVFRTIHGEAKDAYWDKGVTDKALKADAYKRSLDYEVEDRLAPETYLEVVEMKRIVEGRQNWPLFKCVFNIPEPGEKGLAKNLRWMDRINDLRRIPGHPAWDRRYKAEDFDYINFVHSELMKRLREAQQNPVLEVAETPQDGDA